MDSKAVSFDNAAKKLQLVLVPVIYVMYYRWLAMQRMYWL
jgi:hypothetical protein